ncbi:MAG: 4'-phosphopantetheinyl transferase superfamily protein [Gammaproteobacteria bacterium]|nr:4'-phosphopantetheinyl transferase superfamily protein [Gammaproteobacteria bacterium]
MVDRKTGSPAPGAESEAATDPLLAQALQTLRVPDLLLGHRIIMPGDEDALLPTERAGREQATLKVRRQSGAVRRVARELLEQLDLPGVELPRLPNGAPKWPAGIVGSLAHDKQVAVAAVMPSTGSSYIGIDVEPAEPLPPKVMEAISTPGEQRKYDPETLQGRALFCAKEAVYKAFNSKTGQRLGFQDVDIDLASGEAVLKDGGSMSVAVITSPRIVVLARYTE